MATFFFLLSLLLASSAAQEANTDAFFVKDFLQKTGGEIPPATGEESSPSICSWRGISCDFKGERVLSLSAAGVGLAGDIPENTIGKLNMLQHLDLSENNITGFSSDFWGLGSSLRSLNLSGNQISGPLPNDLGNFGLLESLDLSGNLVSGEIPTTVGSLSTLKLLNLRENKLEGKIPGGILGCKSLSSVDLSSNRLSGRLVNFSGMVSLSSLNLSGNLLQGSVHGAFRVPLKALDLSRNQFQGSVSSDPSFNWSRLELLDLSDNQLSGELFPDLNQARSLTHLNLARNRFSRQKFPNVKNLSRLRYLNLSSTGLSGGINPGLVSLSRLILLDLSKNHLTGRVPDLKSAGNLAIVDLSFNNLTGEIPPSLLQKLPELKNFNFSFNNLSLCCSNLLLQTHRSSFLGAQNDCPLAANPELVRINRKRQWKLKLAVVVVAAAAGTLFLSAALLWLVLKSRRRVPKPQHLKEDSIVSGPLSIASSSVPLIIFEKPLLSFTFSDLLSATSNFDRGTLLAEGRLGPVYSGFLPGGLHVAIKILTRSSSPPDEETASKELDRLGRIRHPNIVPLSGYCISGDQRIAIFEFMENGNLQNLLHDLPLGLNATEDWSNDSWDEERDGAQSITSEGQATWRFRHKIALGIARALAYLHHGCIPQISHLNVKSSSIYLDSSFEPRLGDFGLGKIIGGEIEEEISNGSAGYSPPELAGGGGGAATAKSDVYAFGVVLFELVTGKKPIGDEYEEGEKNLVSWVRGLAKKKDLGAAVDPKVRETGPEKQIEEALRIGYLCTAESPAKRPSMQQIVGLLKDIEPLIDH